MRKYRKVDLRMARENAEEYLEALPYVNIAGDSDRNRELTRLVLEGNTLKSVGEHYGITGLRVSQVAQKVLSALGATDKPQKRRVIPLEVYEQERAQRGGDAQPAAGITHTGEKMK